MAEKKRVVSEETRRKMSEARKGKKRAPLSDETKLKISESVKKTMSTEESRAKYEASRLLAVEKMLKTKFERYGFKKKEVKKRQTRLQPVLTELFIEDADIEFEKLKNLIANSNISLSYNRVVDMSAVPNICLRKTEEYSSKGIQLLHIFENEWLLNRDIWKSVILSKLGKNEIIYARKCEIRDVSDTESKVFLIENHLQGYSIASVRKGLYYNNELAAIMTFGKLRFSKEYDYELIRYCSKKFINVVGGASRLLKAFTREHSNSKIVSYANRRWSNGSLYERLGFTLVRKTAPNYFYFKNPLMLESRLAFQKHKLKDRLPNFDENLTETENMYNHGYRKIYDCGNLVYELSV